MRSMPMTISTPPRHVPLSLAAVNLFNGFAQIGWFVFGFGMIFAWAFGGNADMSFITFRGPHAQSQGRVTRVAETGASQNEQTIVANHYEFSVAGTTFKGTSYSSGSGATEGANVTIEYDEDNPERSRIAGMRRKMFGPLALISGLFALIGALFIVFATRTGLRRNHLLRHGVLTTGAFVEKRGTNMTINDRPVWEMVYEFTGRDGRRHEATARSTDTARLEDDPEEPLLYDPERPDRAYVLDEAPARPEFEMTGELRGRPRRAIFAVILPGIVIAANAFVFAIKMGWVDW